MLALELAGKGVILGVVEMQKSPEKTDYLFVDSFSVPSHTKTHNQQKKAKFEKRAEGCYK